MASPTDVAGLTGWFRASDIPGPPADGDPIGTWSASAGSTADYANATASQQPLYRASGVGGQPSLQFDGVDDSLTSTTGGANPETYFLVLQSVDTHGLAQAFGGTSASFNHETEEDPTGSWSMASAGGSGQVTGTPVGASPIVICCQFNVNNAVSEMFENGTSQGTITWTTTRGRSQGRVAGDPGLLSGRFFEGYVAEVIIYSGVYLSAADRATVHTYVQNTYGIAVSDYAGPASPVDATVALTPTSSTSTTAAPTLTAQRNTTLTASRATSTSSAQPVTVTAQHSAILDATPATAASAARAVDITTGHDAVLTLTPATSTSTAAAVVLRAQRNTTVALTPATATSSTAVVGLVAQRNTVAALTAATSTSTAAVIAVQLLGVRRDLTIIVGSPTTAWAAGIPVTGWRAGSPTT